jgi:predicted alpha/beta hydrolase family esterase
MKQKQQVVLIHGGDTYDSSEEYLQSMKREKVTPEDFKRDYVKKWRDTLTDKLGSKFEVFYPKMPNPDNARYGEWKAWFEKLLKFTGPDTIFIGHSLGAIFLAKYFSEPNKVRDPKAVILVAPPFGVTDFRLPADTSGLAALGKKLHMFFSKDDPLVSFQNHYKYRKIAPDSQQHIFTDRGHFIGTSFPEIVKLVKNLAKSN